MFLAGCQDATFMHKIATQIHFHVRECQLKMAITSRPVAEALRRTRWRAQNFTAPPFREVSAALRVEMPAGA